MAQYYQQHHDGAEVLTPATRVGFGGGSDDTVYVIPVAEATPTVSKKANKRRRDEDGRDSVATLDSLGEGSWRETLFGSCCAASPTYWLRVAFCPCATAAAVNERLGSSYELALLYFGVLASGLFVCTGLAITYDQTNRKHHPHRDYDGFPSRDKDDDWMNRNNLNSSSFGSGFDGSSWPPPPFEKDVSLGKNPEFWAGLAVVCVLLFLLGVWMLRDQTRKRLSLRGTKLGDLVVSFACSCCALGQMDLELSHSKLANKRKKERRQQQRDQNAQLEAGTSAVPVVTVASESASTVRVPRHDAADTLAAYPTAALV